MLWQFAGEASPRGALSVDAAINIARGKTADVHEGVSAFLEKRPPAFPCSVSADMPASDWWTAGAATHRR